MTYPDIQGPATDFVRQSSSDQCTQRGPRRRGATQGRANARLSDESAGTVMGAVSVLGSPAHRGDHEEAIGALPDEAA
jgi:hypothetical protein